MLIECYNFAVLTVVLTLIVCLAGLIYLRFSGTLTTMMVTVLVTTFTNYT